MNVFTNAQNKFMLRRENNAVVILFPSPAHFIQVSQTPILAHDKASYTNDAINKVQ